MALAYAATLRSPNFSSRYAILLLRSHCAATTHLRAFATQPPHSHRPRAVTVWIREPEDYDEWITLLQEIDQKLRSRNNSKKGKSGPPPAPNRATVPSGNAGYSKNPKDSWSNKEFTGAAPMDLSAQRRSQLRQETYDKRMQARVCTRCGDPKKDGHLRAQCPHKSMQLSAATAAKEAAEDSSEESGKEYSRGEKLASPRDALFLVCLFLVPNHAPYHPHPQPSRLQSMSRKLLGFRGFLFLMRLH
jgi:hypothetical protein